MRGVLGVLAARYLGQAVMLRHPTPARRRLTASLDALHGVTAVAWGLRGTRARELGWVSAGVSAVAVLTELPPRT